MVKIKWLKSAKEDLKDIYSYISSDSKRYARLQIEKILKRTEILRRHILIGKIVEELNNPLIR
jgi:toxin ParE1/3/4